MSYAEAWVDYITGGENFYYDSDEFPAGGSDDWLQREEDGKVAALLTAVRNSDTKKLTELVRKRKYDVDGLTKRYENYDSIRESCGCDCSCDEDSAFEYCPHHECVSDLAESFTSSEAHKAKRCALDEAARLGNVNVIAKLLKLGASPNGPDPETHETPLFWAMENRHYKAIHMLLSNGANPNGNGFVVPILYAAENNDVKLIRLLKRHGAILEPAINSTYFEFDSSSEENPMPNSSVGTALWHDSTEACEELLSQGVDVNRMDTRGDRLLHAAVASVGLHIGKIRYLLKNGAAASICKGNRADETPLHTAMRRCDVDFFKELVTLFSEFKEDFSVHLEFYTPLLLTAVSLGAFKVAYHLIAIGVEDVSDEETGTRAVDCVKYIGNLPKEEMNGLKELVSHWLASGIHPNLWKSSPNLHVRAMTRVASRSISFFRACSCARRTIEILWHFGIVSDYVGGHLAMHLWRLEHPLVRYAYLSMDKMQAIHENDESLDWMLKWEDFVRVVEWVRRQSDEAIGGESKKKRVRRLRVKVGVKREDFLKVMVQ